MKYAFSNQSGFSLVETLVAVTILLLIIIGPMTISSATARSTSFSSEQVVAFFLAQEGAEIAQKARDDLLLANFATPEVAWGIFTKATLGGKAPFRFCFESTGCALQLHETSDIGELSYPWFLSSPNPNPNPFVHPCSPATNTSGSNDVPPCLLRYQNTGERARYQYPFVMVNNFSNTRSQSTDPATPYTRVINFQLIDANQVKVTSTVTWRTGSQRKEQQVVVETYLFNVYGN